jgi:molecular chaperone GrpE
MSEPLPEHPLDEDVPTPETQTAEAGPELEQAKMRIAELEGMLAEAEKKAGEVRDQALRALAEAENTRKRMERAREDTAKFAVSAFARDLLTVADNLRRALSSISREAQEKSPELKNIYVGVAATERELMRVLESNGIRRIEPMDEKFDPNLHEVMFEAAVPGKEAGTIIQVIDPGYTIHERLLRPARVGVAKDDSGGSANPGSSMDEQV